MCLEEIPGAMVDANLLCAACAADEDKRAAAQRLDTVMVLSQGVPSTVGSGRQTLDRKVHAILHATRLTHPSWKQAVAGLNSTASWTG